MITAEEKKYILENAYIPEHVVGLMTRISGAEPFLLEDYFCCRREDWVIVVGYPIKHDYDVKTFESLIDKVRKRFRPRVLSLMAPEVPPALMASSREREIDHYFTVDIPLVKIKSSLRRMLRKAGDKVKVEHSTEIHEAHKALMAEFVERVKPPPRVKALLLRMEGYVGYSQGSVVLNALDENDNLSAFYVVDLAAKDFSAYVIGCHSKTHYVVGASDLLCHEMIKMSEEEGKKYVHLGLGVNEGIRKFKEKWGGVPTRRYEMCELVVRRPSILDAIRFMR